MKIRKNINYTEIVLKTVLLASVVSVAIIAPNALQMFSFLANDKSRATYHIKTRTQILLQKDYLRQTKTGLELTDKGKQEVFKYTDLKLKKPKKWNGKWTVISFDFNNKRKKLRDLLRFHLKRIGFVRLQDSVWVFPYECEEVIELIKTNMNLKREIVYIRAQSISNEGYIKKIFDL